MPDGQSGSDDEHRPPAKRKMTIWLHIIAYSFIPWWGSLIFFAVLFAACCAFIPILGGDLSRAIMPLVIAFAIPVPVLFIFRYRYRSLFDRAWRNYRSGTIGGAR
jgi:hypothetical protein